jgi:hypothetical protein
MSDRGLLKFNVRRPQLTIWLVFASRCQPAAEPFAGGAPLFRPPVSFIRQTDTQSPLSHSTNALILIPNQPAPKFRRSSAAGSLNSRLEVGRGFQSQAMLLIEKL